MSQRREVEKVRIVIDTNVLISAVFFGGTPKFLLGELKNIEDVYCVASEEIICEYHIVFKRMEGKGFRCDKDVFGQFLEIVQTITVDSDVKVCRDPDDDKFINCALDGKCKYIVSGDKDLLDMKNYANVEIITVREFLNEYDSGLTA